jgi:hypothetical protein
MNFYAVNVILIPHWPAAFPDDHLNLQKILKAVFDGTKLSELRL